MNEFEAIFNESTIDFNVSFEDFITLYRGVERVWIGDGTDGTNGVLYAELVDGVVQTVGPVTGYYYAQQAGFTGTFMEWVQIVLDATIHAQEASDSANEAKGSEISARNSASNAAISEQNAAVSETNAAASETSASASASLASSKAAEAATAESNAATASRNAAASELNAFTYKNNAASSASNAATSEASAAGYASDAADSAEDSEAYATGKRNGADVPSSDPTYHNNSKYYSEQAGLSAASASTYATNASQSAASATQSALDASSSSTAATNAQTAAETAQSKAENAISKYPRIRQNNNWETWDVSSEQWVDTGHKSIAEATVAYAYQNSSSGTVIPTGTWSSSVNPVKGEYMWTRITYTWTNGTVDHFYTVSYEGLDGLGAVISVNGQTGRVTLDGSGINVDDTAQTIETMAQAINRVDNIKEYASFNNFPVTGESGKLYIAEDTNTTYRWDMTTLAYVSVGSGSEEAVVRVDFNILTTDWSAVTDGYSASISDNNINVDTEEIVLFDSSVDNYLTSNILYDKTGNSIVFKVTTMPTGTISGKILIFVSNISTVVVPIDDTAGAGDVNKLWSADKINSEIRAKYTKPSTGIPASDLAVGVANGVATLDASGHVPGSQLDIVNALDSTSTDKPLSAAQGKALNDQIAQIDLTDCVQHGSWRSGQTLAVPSGGTYSTILFVGYLQGHGNVSLFIYKNNTTLTIKTASTDADFTSGYHTFTLSGNDIVISSSASGKSEGTFFIGAWT